MKKILIVEDDQDVARILTFQLKNHGYQVNVAYDALQAFQFMQQENFDLVILDISIPAGSGFSVAERIRSFPKFVGTPFIFVSASPDQQAPERAKELGAKAFMKKPYDINELLKTIDDVFHATNI